MCGVTGYFSLDKNQKISIELMNSKLAHRGPDNDGVYYDEDYNLGLGHRRLSIIDVDERSNQPFIEDDLVLTFNGEIYNFRSLKEEYLKNETFKTDSDTEVIIKLYQKVGLDRALELMNGMFAFCLLDRKEKKMFLCRDRIGKKPLYYVKGSKQIVFASEIKSFAEFTNLTIDADVFNDAMYNRYSYKFSPYKNVSLLDNGSYLSVDLTDFSISKTTYFRFEDLVDENLYKENCKKSEKEIIDELEELLQESIRIRMISDVEVGTINSGGLDSSLLSAMILENHKLKMFHIDVEGDSEYKYAKILADKVGVEIEVDKLVKEGFVDKIDKVIRHYEYPLVHPNAYGIYLLSNLSRSKNVKVLISGDGADELFGGYEFYKTAERSNRIPMLLKKIAKKLYTFTLSTKLPSIYSQAILDSGQRKEAFSKKYSFIKDSKERYVQAVLLSSLYEYLQPLNIRADKMGMANSVEFRCPFLDINIVKFAVNLPLKYKLHKSEGKKILKKLAERKLPNSIIYRKKMGFPVPLIDKAKVNEKCSIHQNYVLYSKDILSNYQSL